MKHILITTIAAALLVGCGNPQAQENLTHEEVSNANIEDTKQHLAAGTDVIAQKEPLEYEAEGSLTLSQWNPLGVEISRKFIHKFNIFVKGKNWLIKENPVAPKKDMRKEHGYDNGVLYSLITFDTKIMDQKWKESKLASKGYTKPQATANGAIYSKTIPCPVSNFSQLVWLAFISGSYANGNETKELPLMWITPDRSIDYKPFTKWSFNEESPWLTEKIIFRNDGKAPVNSGIIEVFPPPYDKGFMDAKYNLNQTTNINGVTFPLSFAIDVFRRNRQNPKNANDLDLRFSLSGKVEKISLKTDLDSFQPNLTGLVTDIRDHRFALNTRTGYNISSGYEQPLMYTIRKGETWKTMRELKKTSEYKALKRMQYYIFFHKLKNYLPGWF